MERRRTNSDYRRIVFIKDGNVFRMPLPLIFEMPRGELVDFLPQASRFWLYCAVIALYDKVME